MFQMRDDTNRRGLKRVLGIIQWIAAFFLVIVAASLKADVSKYQPPLSGARPLTRCGVVVYPYAGISSRSYPVLSKTDQPSVNLGQYPFSPERVPQADLWKAKRSDQKPNRYYSP